jgi:hypothetical protein
LVPLPVRCVTPTPGPPVICCWRIS